MRSLLIAAIVSGMVGCVGELDMGPGGGDDAPVETCGDQIDNDADGQVDENCNTGDQAAAKMMFEQNVYPTLKALCVSCHNAAGPVGNLTGFVNNNAAQGYDTATGYVALVGNFAASTAPILTKISAGHQSIVYTSDQTNKITAWLDKELQARGAGSGGGSGSGTESPSQVSARLLKEWSGCMDKTKFDAANMATAWGTMNAGGSRCQNCHPTGAYGFIATTDSELMFTTISTNKYYMLQYFAVDLTDLANAKVIINTQSFIGVSQGKDPHREHPRFNATQNQGMTALQSFYTAVKTARDAAPMGVCGPSKLLN